MKTDRIIQLARARADGGTRPCPEARLSAIKDEFRQICTDAGATANDRRALAEDIRFCRWEGQSPDGKKHDTEDKPAFPFEGASDARIRLADGTINEQVMILMAALMRANPAFTLKGAEADDTAAPANLGTLWRHVLGNHLGAEWFVENSKVAQWRQGDSPAVAFWQVYWKQEVELQTVELDADGFREQLGTLLAEEDPEAMQSPDVAADIENLLADPEAREALAGVLLALYPDLPEARADKVARQLQERGAAVFPYRHDKEGRLCIKARRLNDDLFIPENTPSDLQRARGVWVREWFTEVELREMESRGEFVPGFVDEVLKHEGTSGWIHHTHYDQGRHSESIVQRAWDSTRNRGQFEILTAFYKAANDDGVPGIYSVMYHHAVDFAGTPEELQNYKTGKYFFIPAQREILADSLWHSRGIAELAATDQQGLKLLHDSFMDHAQLCTVPPITVPASRPKMQLVIGPLKQIKEQRPGEIKFMTMAQYPQSNDKVQQATLANHDRYFGRMAGSVPPDLIRLYGQNLIDFFLLEVRQVMRMGLQIVLQFMPEETLQRVLGSGYQPMSRDIREIQGMFDVDLSFEAGMLQFDFMKEVGNLISTYVLAWDTQSTVKRDELIAWFMGSISPQLAARVLRPVEDASADEIKDEENNFAKIAAGVEPPMAESGQNFSLRLDVQLGIAEKNPEAIQKLTPASRAIWEARLQHLQGQVMQEQNKIIGRTMARPALENGPAAV